MKRLAFALLAACSTDTFTGGQDSGTDAAVDVAPDTAPLEGGNCTTPPACSAGATCNSFDDTQQNSFAPFSDSSVAPGSLAFSTDEFVSCPQSAVATISTGAGGARAALGMAKPITNAVSAHGRIEMDIFLPKTVTGGSTFVLLYANTDPSGSGVALEWAGGQWFVRLRASNTSKNISPRVGAWNHVALDVTFSSANNLGKVEFDYTDSSGATQSLPITDSTLPGATATITALAFTVGIVPLASVSGDMTAYIDDVVFSPQ